MEQQIVLENINVTDLQEGRKLLEDIVKETSGNLQQMRDTTSNERWKVLSDRNYELKQCRHKVQTQMTKIFKAKRIQRNEGVR